MQGGKASWQDKVKGAPESPDATVATVVLVRGEAEDGRPQWAYALIPADRYQEFRMAEEAGAYDLADFGTVLHHGLGEEPPQAIREHMAAEYGCNPRFEEELAEALEQAAETLPEWYAAFGGGEAGDETH